jgi:alpha-L-fucosidase
MKTARPARVVILPAILIAGVIAASLGSTLKAADEVAESTDAFGLPAKDSPEVAWWRKSMETRDQRLSWFREARFGMFIHWGVYSGLGNQFHGKKGGGYAEHVQRVLKIPIPVYRKEVAGSFNPTNFDADTWVRLAKEAGMGYIVITAKHHDGFAMWPSKVNDYNIMDATPWHHDPMKDLKAACDKYGLKFGFYYSQAFDWGNENAPGNDWDYKNPGGDTLIGGKNWWETKPEFLPKARKYVDEKAIPQIRELIKLYHPAILWFDTAGKLPPSENLRIMKAIREADPNVVISGRLVHGWGDYDDTTDRPANFPPHDGDWEGIPTTDESYGWNPFDKSHKPPAHFVQLIAKAAARGGNVLLNIGPMGDGNIDPKDVSILQGIGDWWKVNGESIRGTTRTPLPVQTWGESTRKGDTLYLHVFNWPAGDTLTVGGLQSEVGMDDVSWLDKRLSWHFVPMHETPRDLSLRCVEARPAGPDTVVVLHLRHGVKTDPTRLLQPMFPVETLRAFDGDLHGGLKFGPGKKTDDYVIDWTKPGQYVSWHVRLNQPATYEVTANYSAPGRAGGTYAVSFGSQTLTGTVQAGATRGDSLGKVSLPPGTFDIKVSPVKMQGELMRLRSLELKPVSP